MCIPTADKQGNAVFRHFMPVPLDDMDGAHSANCVRAAALNRPLTMGACATTACSAESRTSRPCMWRSKTLRETYCIWNGQRDSLHVTYEYRQFSTRA